jgi:hypothetical protein
MFLKSQRNDLLLLKIVAKVAAIRGGGYSLTHRQYRNLTVTDRPCREETDIEIYEMS